MKKSIVLLLLCCTFSALYSQNYKLGNKTSKAVESYFTESLSGTKNQFCKDATIAHKKIASARSAIWNIWEKSVRNYSEEKLIELGNLEDKNSDSWRLPENLEPNAIMPYYWGINGTVEEGEKYPMFLYMHGSGNKEQEWSTGLALSLQRFHSPGAYFIPQIPNAYGELYRWAIQSKQWAWEKLLRLVFLNDKIDANRIYFFGISEGGYGSQRLAAFYADYLAGAGPMAGGEPLKNAPMENVANIAFSLRTGAADYAFCRNMLTANALNVANELEKNHPGYYNHFIDVIPERGHSIDYAPTTPWLAKFTRNPHPKYFYWENFDMYGRYRETFYNLRVNETSRNNDQQRTCYEVAIEDNTINLNVKNVEYTCTEMVWGIEMLFSKSFSNAEKGNVTIFLNEELFNLEKPIKIVLNGTEIFNSKVKTSLKTMVESCALFYDPERLFPAAIDVDIEKKRASQTH